jgi:glycosyltransferase involved in cell wall biosynthesis
MIPGRQENDLSMRILIVSWYMPPFNTMGALRVGKLCKFLNEQGHDVRVVSCRKLPFERTLTLEFPEERIVRSGYWDVMCLPKAVQRVRVALGGGRDTGDAAVPPASSPNPAPSADTTPPSAGLLRTLLKYYETLVAFPDGMVGWLPHGLRAGKALLQDWSPDVVLGSAPPFTSILIARALSRRARAPLVVEYRDRYFEDPYHDFSRLQGFRKKIDRWIENWWMKPAKGIVTVSEPWAEEYRARYGLPAVTVYNGFDPVDFPLREERAFAPPETLRIVYTGVLYTDRRDPSPLFAAIKLMGERGKSIQVDFYGADPVSLQRMASAHGVLDQVNANDRVSYADSIDLQMNADILLLLQWNDDKELGNVPGKVFEYIASRRPVLGLGPIGGVPARILQERDAGAVINEPELIAARLVEWQNEKREKGELPLLPASVRDGLSRSDQYANVEKFLASIVEQSS